MDTAFLPFALFHEIITFCFLLNGTTIVVMDSGSVFFENLQPSVLMNHLLEIDLGQGMDIVLRIGLKGSRISMRMYFFLGNGTTSSQKTKNKDKR
jgi:hypothetical protein